MLKFCTMLDVASHVTSVIELEYCFKEKHS